MEQIQNEIKQPEQIDVTKLLIAEFKYLATTAFQNNEDRARVSQFFFVTFGTFIAAILTSQIINISQRQIYWAFMIAFCLICIFGGLTIYQLSRLRLAWLESVKAMNQMKDTAMKQHPELQDFFRWTSETIPPNFNLNSVGFILAVMVALLSGLALGSAVAFGSLAQGSAMVPWGISVGTGVVTILIMLSVCYWLPLSRAQDKSVSESVD